MRVADEVFTKLHRQLSTNLPESINYPGKLADHLQTRVTFALRSYDHYAGPLCATSSVI